MPVNLPYDFAAATSVSGAQLQEQFDAIADMFGALTAADSSATASYLLSQLEGSYEHMDVKLKASNGEFGAAWPGGDTLMDFSGVPGVTGDAPWVCTDVYWGCDNTGDGNGTFKVQWGAFDTGAWVAVGDVCAATNISNAAGAKDTNSGVVVPTGTTYSMAVGATPRFLALISTAAGGAGTTIDGTALGAEEALVVNCRLIRQITDSTG